MSDYYDRAGHPIEHLEWARLFELDGYKRVLLTELLDGGEVSTVWLGLNHSWRAGEAPLIFETMVFGGPHDQDQWRWHTQEEAEAGHTWIVAQLDAGKDPTQADVLATKREDPEPT